MPPYQGLRNNFKAPQGCTLGYDMTVPLGLNSEAHFLITGHRLIICFRLFLILLQRYTAWNFKRKIGIGKINIFLNIAQQKIYAGLT